MATYTWSQLSGSGASSTETITATNQKIKLDITTPAYSAAGVEYVRRSDADVGQCSLIIETLNLGMNPTVVAQGSAPFGANPSLDYFTDPLTTTEWAGCAVFYTQIPGLGPQETTFETCGITHNLQYTSGANLLGNAWQTGYLPAGEKIVTFNFPITVNDGEEIGITNIYFHPPVNQLLMYGNDGRNQQYGPDYNVGKSKFGSIRFRGIGGISLVTTVSSF